jgi:hypothetical protein
VLAQQAAGTIEMARDLDTECVEKMLAAVIEAAGECDVTIAPLKSMLMGRLIERLQETYGIPA